MPTRLALTALALTFACAVSPALASPDVTGRTRVIAQASSKKGSSGVTLYGGLTPGHKYRIEIVSAGKFPFTGSGFQNYTYQNGKNVGQGTKGFTLKGSTPFYQQIRAPISSKLTQWVLAVEVAISGRHALTVRYRDLGLDR